MIRWRQFNHYFQLKYLICWFHIPHCDGLSPDRPSQYEAIFDVTIPFRSVRGQAEAAMGLWWFVGDKPRLWFVVGLSETNQGLGYD